MEATFLCQWCEQTVLGKIILSITDYLKGITKKEYTCPNCPHRVTRTEEAL